MNTLKTGPQSGQRGWRAALWLLLSAISAGIMAADAWLPDTTVICPFLASALLMAVAVQLGSWQALGAWAAVGAVSLLVVKRPAVTGMFLAFGYYPVLRRAISKLSTSYRQFAAKFGYFNAVFVVLYAVLLLKVRDQALLEMLWSASPGEIFLLILIYNCLFWIYDFVVRQVEILSGKTQKRLPKWAEKRQKPSGKKERKAQRKAQRARERAEKEP